MFFRKNWTTEIAKEPKKKTRKRRSLSWCSKQSLKRIKETSTSRYDSGSHYFFETKNGILKLVRCVFLCSWFINHSKSFLTTKLLFQKGDFTKAIDCYTKGIQCDPANPVLPANRAMALLKIGNVAAAEVDCTLAIRYRTSCLSHNLMAATYSLLAFKSVCLSYPVE